MNIKSLLVAACMLAAFNVNANNHLGLVVGSFKTESNATSEVARIQRLTGIETHLVKTNINGVDHYRLVAANPASVSERERTKSTLSDIGINGVWTLSLSKSERVAFAKPAQSKPAAAPATTDFVARSEPVEEVLPFGNDKASYFDFCIKKATAAQRLKYCDNYGFSKQSRKELTRQSDENSKYRALMDYCVKTAGPNERKRKCNNDDIKDASSS